MNALHKIAQAEGWDLFEAEGLNMIQRCDEAEVFASDEDAYEHVQDAARAGSALHIYALSMHRRPINFLSQHHPLLEDEGCGQFSINQQDIGFTLTNRFTLTTLDRFATNLSGEGEFVLLTKTPATYIYSHTTSNVTLTVFQGV